MRDGRRPARVRAAAQLRSGFRENRPPEPAREPRDRVAELSVGIHRSACDHTPVAALREADQALQLIVVGGADRRAHARVRRRVRARETLVRIRRGIARLALRSQRIAKRQVQMNGARRRPPGLRGRATRELARVAQLQRSRLRHRRFGKPTHVTSVEAHLVDGLARTPLAKLGRPIGGEDDERHPRIARLDHPGKEVGSGGARSADQCDGRANGFGDTECEEGRRALVDLRPAAQRRMLRRGDRERR